ncbi:bis-aminopropyl spermidine synthase family protein [Haloactinospora alba]|uniref:bis-aminopropyl spermidine synthase family protein n=1 Tax=Haloactinospora alba TaxID=405555 RepID=UPI001FE44437|nr:bis-aminopropyl spermidine synthase family protein [Haloactinospora alba]
MTDDYPSSIPDLLNQHGINATRIHHVLATLSDGSWWSPRELVRATAVPHRLVDSTLVSLGTEVERDGDRVRLARPDEYLRYHRSRAADPFPPSGTEHAEAAEQLRRIVAEAPPPRTELDHVAATAETALRRGVLLDSRFALSGARLLFVGDHDLTSLATAMVCPDVEARVVDIDERTLEYIDTTAGRLGLAVRCYFADLRLDLPSSLQAGSDLVFTDPPYTPEGVETFVRRGLEGLADFRQARLLLAYGASETTPTLTAKTQTRLLRLNLAIEAMWPDFNRYTGAEAIGAASDLYVLRPTPRTPAPRTTTDRPRIYSRGENAAESEGVLPETSARAVLERSAADTTVGAWPVTPADPARQSVRLEDWLSSPTPADRAAVNLTGGWEDLLLRVVLASSAAETHVLVSAANPHARKDGYTRLQRLLRPRFDLRILERQPTPGYTLLVASERETAPSTPAERLLLHCQQRAHGNLTSVLREGLVRVASESGAPVNKKGARHRVAGTASQLSGFSLLTLPEHRTAELVSVTRSLTAELPAPRQQ